MSLDIAINEKERNRIIKLASHIALWGNAALALFKIIAGLLAGSLSVLGDGIDSSTDVAIAAMSLFVSGIISRPADHQHPFGHGRAETIATTVLSFVLFFAAAQLILQTIATFIQGRVRPVPGSIALFATLVSVLGKFFLAINQYRLGKKSSSPMLLANAKNMRNDIVLSISVTLGLVLSKILNAPIIDPIVAFLVGLWILKTAYDIFMETNLELMDGSEDTQLYQGIFEAVHNVPGAENPHRVRMRCIAGAWDIDLDIEVDACLSVKEAHDISTQVEREIRKKLERVFDIVVHIEPAGCEIHNSKEVWGLTEKELQ